MLSSRLQVRQFQVLASRLAAGGQSQAPPKPPAKAAATAKPAAPPVDDTPVGPGASKAGAYKNAEYFKYNPMSYFDIEVDMNKDRLPQPSSRTTS